MSSPAIKCIMKYDKCVHIKVIVKCSKDYLNGTSGRESELPENNVSSDGIASGLG